MRMIGERAPDDVDPLFPAVFDEVPADDITGTICVAAGHKSGHGAHSGCRLMEYTAGVRHPGSGELRSPGGKQVRALTSGRIAVEEQFIGTDVVSFPDLLQRVEQCLARPLFRLPVVVVFEARRNEKCVVVVGPFPPAESAGGHIFA